MRAARAWCRARVWLVPVVLLLCVTLPHLGQGDWMRTDGAWYGAIAVQGWRSGELWTLHAEPGTAYFNKPPLALWIHGLVLAVFGVGPWQARLPSVLAAGLCVVSAVGLCRARSGEGGWGLTRHGAASVGVVLALTIEFFRRTREISLDLWQAAFLMLAAWAVARGLASQRGRWVVLAGAAVGLALLCKPFMAMAGLGLLTVWVVWEGGWQGCWKRGLWCLGSLAAAIAVAAPWHVGMMIEHGDAFTAQYFGAEVGARASGEFTANSAWAKPWWFYFEQIATSYWPWLVAVVLACVSWARGQRLSRSGAIERWALVWVVGWLVVLTVFPDRRDRYALPVWPGLAVFGGMWIARWPWGWLRSVQRWLLCWGWAVVAAGAVVFSLLPVQVQRPVNPQWPEAIAWLEAERPEELWVAGRQTGRMARLYLELGEWPRATHDRWNQPTSSPTVGAVILYHTPDGVVPGANEREVFRSGNLLMMRLEAEPWKPAWP